MDLKNYMDKKCLFPKTKFFRVVHGKICMEKYVWEKLKTSSLLKIILKKGPTWPMSKLIGAPYTKNIIEKKARPT